MLLKKKNLYWKYLQDCKSCVVSEVERWKSLISQMEIKPSKYHIIFNKPIIEPVPAVLEEPIKSLGCWSDVNLNNRQVQQIREDIITGLKHINSTALLGKKGQQPKLEAPEFQPPCLSGQLPCSKSPFHRSASLGYLISSHMRSGLDYQDMSAG